MIHLLVDHSNLLQMQGTTGRRVEIVTLASEIRSSSNLYFKEGEEWLKKLFVTTLGNRTSNNTLRFIQKMENHGWKIFMERLRIVGQKPNEDKKLEEAINAINSISPGMEENEQWILVKGSISYSGKQKGDCDPLIMAEMLDIEPSDTVILVSGDGDFLPSLKKLHQKGVRIYILCVDDTRCSNYYLLDWGKRNKCFLNFSFLRSQPLKRREDGDKPIIKKRQRG